MASTSTAVHRDRSGAGHAAPVSQRATSAAMVELAPRPEAVGEEVRQLQLGERQGVGQPGHLLGLELLAVAPEARRRRESDSPRPAARAAPRRLRRPPSGSTSRPARSRVHAVDHDRRQLDPDLVLQGVRGLDQLVDRRLLGQRHQHDLAADGVAEQLEHLLGLGADRARPVTASSSPRALRGT